MKCKCSLNNNYQVIDICDIKKFNQKISEFTDNSWTQLTISKKFELPPNKPPIKTITKVYSDIKITSTKIIKTPSSNVPNIEGLTLTGKILLVSGYICKNILYVSETLSSSIHSVNSKTSFSTYVVIEENANVEIDNYCIYPCVEDVYLTTLNERTISESITLFLFAHKIVNPLLPVEKISNGFIFKTLDSDKEMARIEFDVTTKKLKVTSTGENYNDMDSVDKTVFAFRISNLNIETSTRSAIDGTQDGANFRTELNDLSFDFGDIIILIFKNNSKVLLSNYPKDGVNYSMIGKNYQGFKVTETGIIPYLLPNKITLNSPDNQPVTTVQFDILTKSILVNSTGNNTDAGSPEYFKMTVLQSDGIVERFDSSVAGNSNGDNFKTALNGEHFDFNDLLSLHYEDNKKVTISNFPNLGDPTYNPKGNNELFKIAINELISESTNIPNAFIFKTSDTDEEMAKIVFDVITKKLVVTSTGKSYNEPPAAGNDVFVFRIANLTTGASKSSSIEGDKDANVFKFALNDTDFEFGDIITLTFRDRPKVLLTNYPTLGSNYLMIANNSQSFQVTPNGIVPDILPNKIILNGANNQPVVTVQFDILTKQILVVSTGNVTANTGTVNYFKMTLLQSDGRTEIIRSVIGNNDNGNVFKATLNSQQFDFNNIVKLEYEDNNKVVVTNFPDSNTPNYNPTGVSEKFSITPTGFVSVVIKLPTYFLFKTFDTNQEMTRVEFDVTNKKLLVTSTGRNYNDALSADNNIFSFRLDNSIAGTITRSNIKGAEDANNFKNQLNNTLFNFNDIITLIFKDNSKVLLINYPNIGNEYSMLGKNYQSFKVTQAGIVPNVIPNEITLNSANNQPVITVQFDMITKSLLVNSTGNITSAGGDNYFKMTLLEADGTSEKFSSNIPGASNGTNFKNALSNVKFSFNDILKLEYEDRNKVLITNFPNSGSPIYNPTGSSQEFKLTQNGLVNPNP